MSALCRPCSFRNAIPAQAETADKRCFLISVFAPYRHGGIGLQCAVFFLIGFGAHYG
ncbi:hypothetical protein HMPREF9120_00359 [Neisseria sp. oral taxon 020 str. F0370]|nr:hypothetical protein HMPREF9120_00359 [Neisseria sp. oral taxon 020 str. F0370]